MDLQVDPAQLSRAATEVAAVQHQVQVVIDDLRAGLAGRGTGWQHGTFGTAFAGGAHGYLAAADQLLCSAQNLATTLDNYAAAMSHAAEAWAGADTERSPQIGAA